MSHRDSSISKQVMSHMKRVKPSHTESCPYGCLSVLWIFLLLYEHVEGDVYGSGVKGIEVTEVAEKAKITEVAKIVEITERVQGIWMTARHVIQPVAKMAEASIKTARHVMWSLGEVAV
jgi:hypothetical protein